MPSFPSLQTLLLSATIACAAGNAHANDAAWSCFEGEKFYPEGKTVAIRGRTFGYCAGTGKVNPGDGRASLSIRKEMFVEQSLADEYPGMRYGSIMYEDKVDNRFSSERWEQEVARQEFGGVTYSIQVMPFAVEEAQQSLAEGKLPERARYVSPPKQDTPGHVISCSPAPVPPLPDDYQCSLWISYPAGPQITIKQIIIRTPHFEGNKFESFELNDLPHRVRGLVKAYEALDLTDIIEE